MPALVAIQVAPQMSDMIRNRRWSRVTRARLLKKKAGRTPGLATKRKSAALVKAGGPHHGAVGFRRHAHRHARIAALVTDHRVAVGRRGARLERFQEPARR